MTEGTENSRSMAIDQFLADGGLPASLQILLTNLQTRMGRNLMLYQSMEHALKMVLPCLLTKDGEPAPPTGTTGQPPTLGILIGAFIERLTIRAVPSSEADDVVRASFTEKIKQVVSARNNLAHSFGAMPGVDTYTLEGLQAGIGVLDTHYAEGLELFDHLAVSMLMISEVLIARPDAIPEWRQMNQFLKTYARMRGLQIAFQGPDFQPIVDALIAAEAECPKKNGLTSLACAGKHVRLTIPGFKAADFGGRTLTDLLLASGLFEVVVVPHESGKGRAVYYRSKALEQST